jgi:hypothetical protein
MKLTGWRQSRCHEASEATVKNARPKSVADRAREFAFSKADEFSPKDLNGKRTRPGFWKWYGYLYGAARGWRAGYIAGRRAARNSPAGRT